MALDWGLGICILCLMGVGFGFMRLLALLLYAKAARMATHQGGTSYFELVTKITCGKLAFWQ
ncbi:MAG TPA: hypothetical protein DEH25_00400 [Chloroflexi bacterium]|nr:hypothetical protein [Chloroflexota bacterium]